MPNLVSRVDSFCNFALDARLGAGSSALFGSFECSLLLLFAPAGRSTSFSYVVSAIKPRLYHFESKSALQIHRKSKTYQTPYPSCSTTCYPFVSTTIAQRPTLSTLSSSARKISASGAYSASSSASLAPRHTSSPPTSACIWFPSLLPVLIHLPQTSLSSSSRRTPSSPSASQPLDVLYGLWCLSNHDSVLSLELLKSGECEIVLKEGDART